MHYSLNCIFVFALFVDVTSCMRILYVLNNHN